MIPRALAALALGALAVVAPGLLPAQEEADSRELPAAAPAALREHYLLAEKSTSPDGRYAIIFPKQSPEDDPGVQDQVIELATFTPVGAVKTKDPYFRGRNHGGISAEWSADSANVLVTLDSKWGPNEVHLLELRGGRVARSSALLAPAQALLLPDFRRARAERFNPSYAFVWESPDEDGDPAAVAKFAASGTVKVRVLGNTNPKGLSGVRSWRALFTGDWDIEQARYVKHAITRRSVGTTRGER